MMYIKSKDFIEKEISKFKITMVANSERLKNSVCPIYSVNEKSEPELWGSALLLKINKYNFLVTAAHVIKRNQVSTLYIHGKRKLEELIGKFLTTPTEIANKSKYEFSILLLDNNLNDEITTNYSFWDFTNSDINDIPHDKKLYSFIGYPSSKNKPTYGTTRLRRKIDMYTSKSCNKNIYKDYGVSYITHVIVNYDKYKDYNGKNRTKVLSDPNGMSGGGVWRVADMSSFPFNTEPQLIGIGLEYSNKKHLMVGLKILLVFEAIKYHYPDLCRVLPTSNFIEININKKLY